MSLHLSDFKHRWVSTVTTKIQLPRISKGSCFLSGIWGIILFKAKCFILNISNGCFPVMGCILYWLFKCNRINIIWSSVWLTGITKITLSKTVPKDLLGMLERGSPHGLALSACGSCDFSCPLLMNLFSLLFLTGISLPSNQSLGISHLSYFFYLDNQVSLQIKS